MIISSIHSFVFQGPKTKVPVRRAADQNPLSGEYITIEQRRSIMIS